MRTFEGLEATLKVGNEICHGLFSIVAHSRSSWNTVECSYSI